MGGVFSSNKAKKKKAKAVLTISEIDRAVLDLKNARDRLFRYRAKLEGEEEKLLIRAKECSARKDTKNALQLLRLRKYKVKEVEHIQNQLFTVLQMVDTVQTKEQERDVVNAVKVGKDALKKLHDEMSVDDILNLMEEVQEGHELEREINSIFAGAGENALTGLEESEVENELKALEKEMNISIQQPIVDDKMTENVVQDEEKEADKKEGDTRFIVDQNEEEDLEFPEVPVGKLPQIIGKVPQTTTERPERVAIAS